MKKLLLFLLVFLMFECSQNFDFCTHASTSLTYYARVESPSTYFYSLPIKSDSYRLFEIPVSYFVILSDNENQSFYKAKYCDVEGFVLKENVTPVNETPNYPFALSSFRVFSKTSLYSSPEQESEIVCDLPILSNITTYYGINYGEELIPSSTNLWYFCAYMDNNVLNKGYVFSYYCDQFQKIQTNNEVVTPILGELEFNINDEKPNLSKNDLSPTTKAIIIISCVIPCVFILILLIKKKSSKGQKVKKFKRKPKQDYFEFNEDDI